MHRTIYNQQTLLFFARHCSYPRHINILRPSFCILSALGNRTNPTPVEPKNINNPIICHQLRNLIKSKTLETLPFPRMLPHIVIIIPIWSRISLPPVIGRTPVGFREVSTNHITMTSERFKDMLRNVSLRIVPKHPAGNAKLRFVRIEHTKSVVMLGSEHQILHPGHNSGPCPLIRIELHRRSTTTQLSQPPNINPSELSSRTSNPSTTPIS